jgi:hypothetical protein
MSQHRRIATVLLIASLAGMVAFSAAAEDIRIVAPYVGSLTDVQDAANGLPELKDTGLLTGLYFQWINPQYYQWNAFAYYAPDVNYAKTAGGNFIFDYYFGPDWMGKFVLGAGLEAMTVNMDAGDAFKSLYVFDLNMKVSTIVPYLRAGKYLKTSFGPLEVSLLPWAGVEPQWVNTEGSMLIDPPGPFPPAFTQKVDSSTYHLYGIAGANLKFTLFHFIDLEGKYSGTFNANGAYYSTISAIANVFLTRSWGLSYRYKYMETSQGSDAYHFFGLAYVF